MKERIKKIFKDPLKLGASSFFFFIICCFYPVNSFLSRSIFLAAFFLFWFSPYIAGIRTKKFIISHSFLTIILLSFPFLFFKSSSNDHLKTLYLKNLKSFEGVSYFWGGENFIGIDCSGLPRKSLINAFFFTGQVKEAFYTWWYDSSARALSENYRDYTVNICSFESLRVVDYSLITSGDLAITSDGVHVLVYLGDEKWIQADPSQGKVVIEDPQTTNSNWFDLKVNIVRWKTLNN